MKRKYFFLIFILASMIIMPQRASIEVKAISPQKLKDLGLTTGSVSSGLKVFPLETYMYLTPRNIANTQPVTAAVFTFTTKPAGSNASFTNFGTDNSVYFKSDVKGKYEINLSITTSGGTDDTTITVFAGKYVGVGNFDGVPAEYPNCMSCHGFTQKFVDIFNEWKNTGHALKFKRSITGTGYYNQSCFKCHTTGSDHDNVAANGGFDDVASELGWTFVLPLNPGKWDSLKTGFPKLSQLANIGCESCHGPGGEHTSGSFEAIGISGNSGTCAQCHDQVGYYNIGAQWENSLHSAPVWSGSFAQGTASQNNNLQNCIRCHDGQGFINFTKGKTTNTTGRVQGNQTHIGCPTCHDPHSNEIRTTPAGSDTLANGYQYSVGGHGQVCMNCHKLRRDGKNFATTQVTNANWGPHYSNQTDIYLGQNAAEFGTPYNSTAHSLFLTNSCVDCHMQTSPDSTSPNYNKVGGHTFSLSNNGQDLTAKCQPCHGNKTHFTDFVATVDWDGNGLLEAIQTEYDNLYHKLKWYLPPVGVDSVSWQAVRDLNNPTINKAYFNYRVFAYDKSRGMHNTKYTMEALRSTIFALGGILNVETGITDVPMVFALNQNYPNPFNPSTTISYAIPEAMEITLVVYDILGKEVKTLVKEYKQPGRYSVTFDATGLTSGVYIYSLQSEKYSATKKFVLMK